MDINQAFGRALKQLRQQKNLTQEDFANVSSRTYISALERGLKSPTIEKIGQLADVIGIHPLTLYLTAYHHLESLGTEALLNRAREESVSTDM